MLLNPYNPGGRPLRFVGRTNEVQALLDRLARVIAFKAMMGPLVVITGPRGVGKTSLLREVADRAAENGFVVAWSTGLKKQPFLGAVAESVTRALERADVAKDGDSRRRLDQLGFQINAGLMKVTAKVANVSDQSALELPVGSGLVGQFEDFLFEASNQIVRRGGAGLLIAIDELHAPLEHSTGRTSSKAVQAVKEAGTLLNAVQNMDAERDRFPLGVIGAGLPQTKPLLMEAATFAERTHEIALSKLDDAAARALLADPALELGVTWQGTALDMAVKAGEGYPQTLQTIGAATWQLADPAEGSVITTDHVTAAQPQVDAEMFSVFRGRWAVATPAERQFLEAMAEHATESVPRTAIAERLGVTTTDLSAARAALIDKGIVESSTYGQLRFTIPGFARFIRDQDNLPPSLRTVAFPAPYSPQPVAVDEKTETTTPVRNKARSNDAAPPGRDG